MREFLNGEFIDTVFSEEEQGRIVETLLENNDNFGNFGGNDTVDRVFLLSISEVDEFMRGDAPGVLQRARIAYRVGVRTESSAWWLRSPGVGGSLTAGGNAASVSSQGIVSSSRVDDGSVGVRPAIWLYSE